MHAPVATSAAWPLVAPIECHALWSRGQQAEPAVTEAGSRLLLHEVPHCRKLDTAALDEIVAQVDRWYDAFFSQIAVRAS
ncbi:MAG TPA: hypothetical protein VEL76_25605 [Gemmataceae bacterium]|nr:hypothetical protein [Gemmataceae bacterium]